MFSIPKRMVTDLLNYFQKTESIRKTLRERDGNRRRKLSVTPGEEETFPFNLRSELVKLLEPDDRLHNNNWKQVANYLKIPFYEVHWLEDQKGTRYGPMEHLLVQWEQERKTLSEFKKLMESIKRMDVVSRIDNYEKIFRKEQTNPKTFPGKLRRTVRGALSPQKRNLTTIPDNNRIRGRIDTNPTEMKTNTEWHHEYLRQVSSNAA